MDETKISSNKNVTYSKMLNKDQGRAEFWINWSLDSLSPFFLSLSLKKGFYMIFDHYMAFFPLSPVLILTTSSTSLMKILPSPISPVLAFSVTVSITFSRSPESTTTSI